MFVYYLKTTYVFGKKKKKKLELVNGFRLFLLTITDQISWSGCHFFIVKI